ncbi:MAG: hypothetical protein R3F02_08965 [Thiolinea sp.]
MKKTMLAAAVITGLFAVQGCTSVPNPAIKVAPHTHLPTPGIIVPKGPEAREGTDGQVNQVFPVVAARSAIPEQLAADPATKEAAAEVQEAGTVVPPTRVPVPDLPEKSTKTFAFEILQGVLVGCVSSGNCW